MEYLYILLIKWQSKSDKNNIFSTDFWFKYFLYLNLFIFINLINLKNLKNLIIIDFFEN